MSRNFVEFGEFKCECGREFTKSQSLYAHQSHCKVHLGDRYDPDKHKGWNIGDARAWNQGRTMDDPFYGGSIRRSVEAMHSAYNPGMTGHHQSAESRLKQSETRKCRYLSGELTPAFRIGRGKYAFLKFRDKKIFLRSSYEFIYALYLLYQGLEFEYESVRVKYHDRVFISDFFVNGKVVEIKGIQHVDIQEAKEAFVEAGYEYEVKFWEDLQVCYDYLKSKIDIDSILESIRIGNDSKQYYEYTYLPSA